MNPFQQYIQSIPQTHNESKRWKLTKNGILEDDQPIDFSKYQNIFKVVAGYFKEWQKMANLEAQVLIVTTDDYEQYYKAFPTLPSNEDLQIVVLPQQNTWSNTIIEDAYWHRTVKNPPIMRIHSHHILDAYQSQTDYEGLNSGTLEVVFGHVNTDIIDVAYWLTQFSDPTAKESVYKTQFSL